MTCRMTKVQIDEFRAKAIVSNSSPKFGELAFNVGDIIFIYRRRDYEDWCEGELHGERGLVRNDHVVRFAEDEVEQKSPSEVKPVRRKPIGMRIGKGVLKVLSYFVIAHF